MIARQQWLDVLLQRRLETLRRITWHQDILQRIPVVELPMDRDLVT